MKNFKVLSIKSAIILILISLFAITAVSCKSTPTKSEPTITNQNKHTNTTKSSSISTNTTTPTNENPSTNESQKAIIKSITVNCNSISNSNNRLLTACAATSAGGNNQSPAISFSPVDNASSYAIYMIDTSAGNWLHWIAYNITDTQLSQGQALTNSQYIGPYPPSGSHTYVIYVFALKDQADSYIGKFDSSNTSIDIIKNSLDISSGNSGNIIGMGSTSVTYNNGDNNT